MFFRREKNTQLAHGCLLQCYSYQPKTGNWPNAQQTSMRRVPIHRKGCLEAAETKTKQETHSSCVEMEACTSQYWEKAKGYINSWHFKYFLTLPVNLWLWGKFIFPLMVIKGDALSHTALPSTFFLWNKATTEFTRLLLNFNVCQQGWLFAPRMGVENASEIKRGSGRPAQSSPCRPPTWPFKATVNGTGWGWGQGVPLQAGDPGMHSLDIVIWRARLLLSLLFPSKKATKSLKGQAPFLERWSQTIMVLEFVIALTKHLILGNVWRRETLTPDSDD